MDLKKEKIGIMGGTFDPPHLGHLICAASVKDALNLDKIIFIPTGNFIYKDKSKTSAAKRYMMTSLATEDNPFFEISDIETSVSECSYTYKTLEKLKNIYPEAVLYFIVGADSLDYMENWKCPELVFKRAEIACVGREGFETEDIVEKIKVLEKKFGGKIHYVEMPKISVSSTEIRNLVKEGRSIKYLVPKAVEEYIKVNKLYKDEG